MTTTEAPTAPDLSSLPKRQRLNIAVAQALGETVWRRYGSGWQLWVDGRFVVYVGDGYINPVRLPDYAGDPAAWGALMERERVCVDDAGDHWVCWIRWQPGQPYLPTCEHPALGVGICAAVLSKYGIDPTPYIGD